MTLMKILWKKENINFLESGSTKYDPSGMGWSPLLAPTSDSLCGALKCN